MQNVVGEEGSDQARVTDWKAAGLVLQFGESLVAWCQKSNIPLSGELRNQLREGVEVCGQV